MLVLLVLVLVLLLVLLLRLRLNPVLIWCMLIITATIEVSGELLLT